MRKKTNFVDRNGNDIFVGDKVQITEVNAFGKTIIVSEGKVYYDKEDDNSGFDDLLEDYLGLCEVIKGQK